MVKLSSRVTNGNLPFGETRIWLWAFQIEPGTLRCFKSILHTGIAMPLFEVRTNQKPSKEEIAVIASELSHVCSNILRKSEDYVMVNIQVDQMLLFAGTDEPAAFGELRSINLPIEETTPLAALICSFLSERLDVPENRIYLSFTDVDRNNWGWNGKTF